MRRVGVPGFLLSKDGTGDGTPDPGPAAPVGGCVPLPGLSSTGAGADGDTLVEPPSGAAATSGIASVVPASPAAMRNDQFSP